MGCTQSDKENFYNFFNARKINGAIIGEKANEVCQAIVGAPFLIGQINTASKVQLAWTGGEGAVKYIIYQSTNNFTFIPVAETTSKEFLVTGLDFLTTYFFRVDAVSYLGDETKSNVITFTMPNVQAPTGLTLDYPDIREVVLTWTSNSNEDEEGFVIERSLDEITWTDIGNTTTGVETFTDLTVIGDLTYFYRVAAFAGVNKSSYSNTVSQFIPVIPTPQDLIAEVTDPTKINLSWTSNSFGDETGFSIERSLDGVTFAPYDQVPSGQNTFFDINITIDVEYFYRVQALESGTTSSGYTNVASAINNLTFRSFNNFDFGFHQFGEITDDEPVDPPLAPTGLALTVVSDSEIDASWDSQLDADSFVVEHDTDILFPSPVTNATNNNSFSITGLTQSTEYFVRVKAVNAGGESPYSNIESATTYSLPFTFTVKSDNSGTSNNDQFTFPQRPGGNPNYVIKQQGVTGNEVTVTSDTDPTTITFVGGAGTYTVEIQGIDISPFFNGTGDFIKILTIHNWGDCIIFSRSFTNCFNLNVSAIDAPLISSKIERTFEGCDLTTFNGLENWDVSNVQSFARTFNLSNLNNYGLGSWDFTATNSTSSLHNFVRNTNLSSTNYNLLLAKLRSDAEGAGIFNGMTLGADGLVATGQGVNDRTWLINNTSMTIIDATP